MKNIIVSIDFRKCTFQSWVYFTIAFYFTPFLALWSVITGKVVNLGVTEIKTTEEDKNINKTEI